MKYAKFFLTGLIISLFSTCLLAQSPEDDASIPPLWTFFPETMDCSEIPDGIGSEWRDIVKIGQSTVEELEAIYGSAEEHDRMYMISEELEVTYGTVTPSDRIYTISGENWKIRFCAKDDNIITALLVGSDLAYFQDYIAVYGKPNAVTFGTNSESRLMFWFEEGIAINVYINTVEPEYFGLVYPVIYFPYQSSEGYENRWPYIHTRSLNEAISARDPNVSDEQNPFDFDLIMATITADPSRTQTPNSP